MLPLTKTRSAGSTLVAPGAKLSNRRLSTAKMVLMVISFWLESTKPRTLLPGKRQSLYHRVREEHRDRTEFLSRTLLQTAPATDYFLGRTERWRPPSSLLNFE